MRLPTRSNAPAPASSAPRTKIPLTSLPVSGSELDVLAGPPFEDPVEVPGVGEADGGALGDGDGVGSAATGVTAKSMPPRISPSSVMVVVLSAGPSGTKPSGGVKSIVAGAGVQVVEEELAVVVSGQRLRATGTVDRDLGPGDGLVLLAAVRDAPADRSGPGEREVLVRQVGGVHLDVVDRCGGVEAGGGATELS